jgi:RHS repeat-associated protein
VSNSAGRSVTYTYSGAHLANTTTDDGKIVSYTYATTPGSLEHALTSVTGAGRMRVFNWDAAGHLASTALDAGQEFLALSYDTAGGVTATDATGGISSSFFDHRGLLIKTVDGVGGISEAYHDHNHRLERLILPTGEQQSFEWHPNGEPKSTTDEFGRTTRMEFNHPLNRLTRLTDANGNDMRYGYDVKGNLLTTTYANNSVERWSAYTPAGLPQTRVNRRNESLNHTFTNDGRLDRRTFADGSFVDFDYDSRGNPVTMTEHPVLGADKVTTFTYAPATDGDRLRRVTYPDGRFVEYFFDADGRRTRMTDSEGGDTRYEYDAVSRLSKLRDAADNTLVEYLYDAAGRLARMNKGSGTATTYSHDAAGRLILLANLSADGSPHSSFAYTYDARGNRRTATTLDGTWTNTYDATRQLIRAVFVSINPAIANQDLRYNYDGLGNRISTVLNGVATNYLTNNLNQYTNIGGTGRLHDADGNLISDGMNSYVYNTLNQLVEVTGPGGVTQHEYSGMGHRSATIVNGQRTDLLLDLTGMVNVLAESGASGLSARNVHGLGLVSRVSNNQPGYFDYDGGGSIIALRGTTGASLNQYVYDPFGNPIFVEEAISNPYEFAGFYGVQREPDSDLFMRARHYQPYSGRFMQADPLGRLGGDVNFYRYAWNDPNGFVDPLGLFSQAEGVGQVAGGVSGAIIGRVYGGIIGGYVGGGLGGLTVPVTGPAGPIGGAVVGTFIGNNFGEIIGGAVGAYAGGYAGGVYDQYNTPPPIAPPAGEIEDDGATELALAKDPNEKLGPAGFGPEAWIAADSILPYRINFENIGPGSLDSNGDSFPTFATAPAQRVTITDQLHADFDWNSFEWSDFGFGDVIIPVSDGGSHFSGRTAMTFNGQTFDVEIDAGIHFNTGLVTVTFQSIDPEIGLPPDVLTGFLPPEDGTGRGKGHISYTIRAKPNLATGTAIRNVAGIRFDSNAIITTDQIDPQDVASGTDPNKRALVTLDSTPPLSSVLPLPASTEGTGITVTWSGSDVGSGVAGYDIYVSEDSGPWTLWLDNTPETSARYSGQGGRTYSFFSVARDHVGLTEEPSFTPDATTTPQDFALMTVRLLQGTQVALSDAKILHNATLHLGVPVTIASVPTTTTNGATITRTARTILFSPMATFAGLDSFPVTLWDGTRLVDGTVTVEVTAAPAGLNPKNSPSVVTLPGGAVTVTFAGIPGRSYHLQRSTDLMNWTPLGTTVATPSGRVIFSDPNPPQPQAFYRLGY